METFSAWMRLEIPRSKSPLVPSLRSAATAKLTSGHGAARSITAAVRFQNHDEQRNHLETCGGKIRGTNRKRWHFWNQNNDGKTPLRFLRLAMEICTKKSLTISWLGRWNFQINCLKGINQGPNPSCCFGLGCVGCLRCLGLRLINQ